MLFNLKDTTYLSNYGSLGVKQVINGDCAIAFPELPFVTYIQFHELFIISFLNTLSFFFNLPKTLLDSISTVLTDSPHTSKTFPVEKHKTFKIYI